MHFTQSYDYITITAMITLEDYSLCEKGESKESRKGRTHKHQR